jgi:membrane glycosyltransferase
MSDASLSSLTSNAGEARTANAPPAASAPHATTPGDMSSRGDRLARYVNRLAISYSDRARLLQSAQGDGGETSAAMCGMHAALGTGQKNDDDPAAASAAVRLRLGAGLTAAQSPAVVARDAHGRPRIATMPPLSRTSVAPEAWPLGFLRRAVLGQDVQKPAAGSDVSAADADLRPPSPPSARRRRAGALRRWSLLGLTLAQTYLATDFMTTVLPYQGRQPLEIVILVLFAILFAWVSAGFWTAVAGFFLMLFGKDRYAISAKARPDRAIDAAARTAIVMPICNEDVPRVFAGLRATYESLGRAGALERFDFFILSDTNDVDVRVAEQAAWLDMCREVSSFGRVFYRWRRNRIKRKSGNLADFCRRWGRNYRYMVVMDADSVMTGECLERLVQMMEASPDAGIIQTIPRAAGRETLHARIQQFAANAYGPMFAAGLHFWQLGESHYWGHNAIIRVEPFMRHCALRRLPGRGVLSGEILSHDFVEAALMRRAGWGVWIAYDLPGSYEEMPPNLLDEIKRDRRWCQGNLMNFRLISLKGVHAVHRAVFLTGVMAYASSPLWFAALVSSTALLAVHALSEPVYFVESYQLFPLWPEWRPERAIALFSTTLSLLFFPKILSMVIVLKRGARSFGGGWRYGISMVGEMLVSALLAPVRMLFHTQFVLAAVAGHSVQWKSPPRGDAETSWGEAFLRHGWQAVLGLAWIGIVYWLDPNHVWWLLPVAGALVVAIPLSVLLSRASLGRAFRRLGLFLAPEEVQGCREIQQTARLARASRKTVDVVAAVVDPLINAQLGALAPRREAAGAVQSLNARIIDVALAQGVAALSQRERLALMDDAHALSILHHRVWSSAHAAPVWRAAIEGEERVAIDTVHPRRIPVHAAAGMAQLAGNERS